MLALSMNDTEVYYSDMNELALDWNAVRVFASVAQHGTLSGAAAELGLSQPTVGRQIARLEASLSLRLFDHHQTGYSLTADGQDLLALANQMCLDAARLERAASNATSARRHRLVRIALGDWAQHFLAPRLSELIPPGAQLQIELVASDLFISLARNEAELALRNVRPKHEHLIAKKVGDTPAYVYASADYCRRNPEVFDPKSWKHQAWIGYGATRPTFQGTRWLRELLEGQGPRYIVNRSASHLEAIRSGCALGILPAWIGEFDGLRRLSDRAIRSGELWLTYHHELRLDRTLRDVKDRLLALYQDRMQETGRRLQAPRQT